MGAIRSLAERVAVYHFCREEGGERSGRCSILFRWEEKNKERDGWASHYVQGKVKKR